jgi:hypothetical protein
MDGKWSGPPLDGSGDGFDTSAPLALDTELQYRRSEEPYQGPETFSATACINWNEDTLFLMVDVLKPELMIRAADAPPLQLDNEVDDIHSDGIQLYLERESGRYGFLVVPELDSEALRVRAVAGSDGDPAMITGGWSRTDQGYRITLGFKPGWTFDEHETTRFDLLVNEMYEYRQRRCGQLVWSGGNGWVYLQGDRQDPSRFGVLELVT